MALLYALCVDGCDDALDSTVSWRFQGCAICRRPKEKPASVHHWPSACVPLTLPPPPSPDAVRHFPLQPQMDGSALSQHMEDFYLKALGDALLALRPDLSAAVNDALTGGAEGASAGAGSA